MNAIKFKPNKNEYNNILIIKNSYNEIVASATINFMDYKYQGLFDGVVGCGGILGVKRSERQKGLGIALKAKGMERLRENGAKYVVVQYTSEPDFYKKLGFKEFRNYHMLRIDI